MNNGQIWTLLADTSEKLYGVKYTEANIEQKSQIMDFVSDKLLRTQTAFI